MEAIQYIQDKFEASEFTQSIIELIQNLTSLGITVNPPTPRSRVRFTVPIDCNDHFFCLFSMPHIPQFNNIENEYCEYHDKNEYDLMCKHSDFIQSQFDKFDIQHMYLDSLDVYACVEDDDDMVGDEWNNM
jgi:hypothetical protein